MRWILFLFLAIFAAACAQTPDKQVDIQDPLSLRQVSPPRKEAQTRKLSETEAASYGTSLLIAECLSPEIDPPYSVQSDAFQKALLKVDRIEAIRNQLLGGNKDEPSGEAMLRAYQKFGRVGHLKKLNE